MTAWLFIENIYSVKNYQTPEQKLPGVFLFFSKILGQLLGQMQKVIS